MNFLNKDVLEKFETRKKLMKEFGNQQKFKHNEYLKAGLVYDNLKSGFYTAIELSRIDKDVKESDLQRYKCLVKNFDHELLKQMKEQKCKVQNCRIEEEDNNIIDRIRNIKEAGYVRNKLYYEFLKEQEQFNTSIRGLYKELLLAVKDGSITGIEKQIYEGPIREFECSVMIEMQDQKKTILLQRKSRSNRNENNNENAFEARGIRRQFHGRGQMNRDRWNESRSFQSQSHDHWSTQDRYTQGRFTRGRDNSEQGRSTRGRYFGIPLKRVQRRFN